MFLIWNESQPHRPTRDVDLLSHKTEDPDELARIFGFLCSVPHDDGLEFRADSVTVEPIREDQRYGGLRVTLQAALHGARIALQIDVGFGDAVTPAAQWIDVPVILPGLARPRMRAYPVYTVIAEKLEAMVQLGIANSRMKDFYDLEFLFSRFPLDRAVLRQAIQRTFARRGTALPSILFAPEFAREKAMPWQQFLRRNKLSTPTRSWDEILRHLEEQMSETLSGSKGL